MHLAFALAATLVSSCALNIGYLLEHSAVRRLPTLSIRSPVASVRRLLGSRRWLLGFGTEAAGWALYVLALTLAPLSLVQATAAGGIGILAIMVSRVTRTPLTRYERLGVVISVCGLVLLGISLAGAHGEGTGADHLSVGLWVAASAAAAIASVQLLSRRIPPGPAYGLAAGILFAAGDVATKGAVEAGGHLGFVAALVAAYGFGTLVLQAGFQRGSALTTAGIATLLTSALPIVAGMTIFGEPLPNGWLGAIRIAAFATVVVGAVFLGERRHAPTAAAQASDSAAPSRPAQGDLAAGEGTT